MSLSSSHMRSIGPRRFRPAVAAAVAAALALPGRQARADVSGDVADTWVGPFTGGTSAGNYWSNASSWSNGIPPSSSTTQLIFPDFDTTGFTSINNLGSGFLLNNLTVNNNSTTNQSVIVANAAGDAIDFTGANPTLTLNGPAADTIGSLVSGSDTGIILAPSSGTTTINGNTNNQFVSVGTSTGTIGGSGGLAISTTGLGVVVLTGTNTFTGGVTLDSGSLSIANAGALGQTNTLTVNGGNVRLGAPAVTAAVTANADLLIASGTSTLRRGRRRTGRAPPDERDQPQFVRRHAGGDPLERQHVRRGDHD